MPTPSNIPAERYMLSIQATADVSMLRTASMHGNTYTVIPCIALVEGVLWPANAPAPELALAEEFGRFPQAWDGRPLVMNHPVINGVPVSANAPGVLDDYAFGQIFNTKLVDNALHTEMWINDARVLQLGGEVAETVERLKSGEEIVEVSTGLFSRSEQTVGIHAGQTYKAVWRNIVPDHLAVLSKGTVGACSGEAGCGAPRINAGDTMDPVMQCIRINTYSEDGAPIIAADAHDCKCKQAAEPAIQNQGIFAQLKDKLVNWTFKFRNNAALSDTDVRAAIRTALNEKVSDYTWIVAVFQESNGSGIVVYETGYEGKLFQRSFSVAETGVSLGESIEEVRPETRFVPVTINAGDPTDVHTAQENVMTKQERVAALIANAATKFTAKDTDFLMTLEEGQLELLEPVAVAPAPAAPVADEPAEPVTMASYLAQAPEEIRAVLNSAVDLQKQQRKSLVDGIKANKRNKFTDAQLEAFDLGTLTQLAEMAEVPSFIGNGVGQGQLNVNASGDDGDEGTAESPDVFAILAQKK